MIKLEHVVLASTEQMEFIIEGMRNPMNSWEKSDSEIKYESWHDMSGGEYVVGESDHDLMHRLAKAGTDHRKYMRMMPVYVRITAPLYWWKEFDTYKVGTVSNSCSTMHKIADKEFTVEDFSCEHLLDGYMQESEYPTFEETDGNEVFVTPADVLEELIQIINFYRNKYLETKDKKYWWQMIQLLPSSYNQTRNVMVNYEVLANIYKSRKDHKLNEWREFCKWIESLPYSELIVDSYNQLSACKNDRTCDIRWAEDIFRNRGIKLTMEQIEAINAITLQNIKSKGE